MSLLIIGIRPSIVLKCLQLTTRIIHYFVVSFSFLINSWFHFIFFVCLLPFWRCLSTYRHHRCRLYSIFPAARPTSSLFRLIYHHLIFFFFVKQNFIYLDKFSPLSMKTNVKRLNALKKIFFLPLFRVLFLCVFSAFFSILLIMSITFSVCLTTKAIFNISNTCHLTKWMVQFV